MQLFLKITVYACLSKFVEFSVLILEMTVTCLSRQHAHFVLSSWLQFIIDVSVSLRLYLARTSVSVDKPHIRFGKPPDRDNWRFKIFYCLNKPSQYNCQSICVKSVKEPQFEY